MMADTPPLPPGFELEEDVPPLPAGFVMEADEGPGLEIDIVGGTPVTAEQFEAESRPSLFRMDSDFRERSGVGIPTMLGAAAKDMFGSRKGAAEFLAERAGGTVSRDERGEPVVLLPDGTSYRLNDAGLDSTDIGNVAGNIAAFLTPAGVAARFGQARNIGMAGRALTQAGAAGATDVGLQAAFDNGRVDPVRTMGAAAGGGLGEVVGTGLAAVGRRGVNALNNATGRNALRAAEVLQAEGVPATPQAVYALAPRIPELQAGANPNALIGAQRYGFTYTQGQRATNPRQKFDLLSQEELLRQSPGGGHVLREAADQNAQRLDSALTRITDEVGGGVGPGATPTGLTQNAAGRLQSIAGDLDARVSDAYHLASQGNRAAISSEAIRGLPQILRTSVADFAPNPTTTPVTARTLEQLQEAATQVTQAEGGKVAGVTLKALETQRRILNNNINAATNRADRAAMVKLKREFDGWMDDAVDTALVSGDADALQAIKQARALRAEFGRRFEGSTDTDRFITGLLDGTKTAEELVNAAFGASQVSKAGGARFIERLRIAADGDPEVIGSLRAAHFLRLSRGNDGQPLAMGQIIRNIRSSDYNNASVVKALYTRQQWSEIRRLASAMEPLVAKGDFARTSGTAERMARMMSQAVGGGVVDLPIVRGIMQGAQGVRQLHQARSALNQPLPLPGGSGPSAPAVSAGLISEGAN